MWKETFVGITRSNRCPFGPSDVRVTRRCESRLMWGQVLNLVGCTSAITDQFRSLNQVLRLHHVLQHYTCKPPGLLIASPPVHTLHPPHPSTLTEGCGLEARLACLLLLQMQLSFMYKFDILHRHCMLDTIIFLLDRHSRGNYVLTKFGVIAWSY